MVNELEAIFPGLFGVNYRLSSPPDRKYNCIAWAAGDTRRWWWPDPPPADERYYWPPDVGNEETLESFMAVFATLGYVPCHGEAAESGWERIALYATGDGVPRHAARQLADGRWSSKLGRKEDIEHGLHDLEGEEYGAVVQIMKRTRLA
jgi:hypothetical protein